MRCSKLFILFSIIVIALSGCSINRNISQPITNPVGVSVNQNNFHFVKSVTATESATYVFGIGGLSRRAVRQNAIAKMTEEANLTNSQVLVNITTRQSYKMITPIFVKIEVTAVGQVMQFDGANVSIFRTEN